MPAGGSRRLRDCSESIWYNTTPVGRYFERGGLSRGRATPGFKHICKYTLWALLPVNRRTRAEKRAEMSTGGSKMDQICPIPAPRFDRLTLSRHMRAMPAGARPSKSSKSARRWQRGAGPRSKALDFMTGPRGALQFHVCSRTNARVTLSQSKNCTMTLVCAPLRFNTLFS
jgi:hypothetical protein